MKLRETRDLDEGKRRRDLKGCPLTLSCFLYLSNLISCTTNLYRRALRFL